MVRIHWMESQLDTTSFSTSVSESYGNLVISTLYTNYAPLISTGTYFAGTFDGDNTGNDGIPITTILTTFMNIRDLNQQDSLGIAIRGFSSVTTSFNQAPLGCLQYAWGSAPYTWSTIYRSPSAVNPSQCFLLQNIQSSNYRIRVSTFSNSFALFNLNIYGWDGTIGTNQSFASFSNLLTTSPQFGSLSYNSNFTRQQSTILQFSNSFVYYAPSLANSVALTC